jgi:hypothetical protein
MLLADRGYDADWIRELAMKRGAWANIPPRSNRNGPICFSPYLYRARNQVERFFNRIKQCRRVATRYDRLAANYLAFVHVLGCLHVGASVHWIFLSVAVGMASFGCLALPGLIRQSGFGLHESATKCPA